MSLLDMLERLQVLARGAKLWGANLVIHVPVERTERQWRVELFNDLHGGMGEPHTHHIVWQGHGSTLESAVRDAIHQAEIREVSEV